MPGKPFQSKLQPYESEIYRLLHKGVSYRRIADRLNEQYALQVSHNAVFSYVKAASRRDRRHFDDGLDRDLRESLLKQLVAVWTHDSTAIEGNTLSLGETAQVLELGLTISGKPLKDHEEVHGHARAIDLIRKLADSKRLERKQLFDLHRAVMPQGPVDVMNPVGAWKREYNGTNGVVRRRTRYLEYSPPRDVPALIKRWLEEFQERLAGSNSEDTALEAYLWSHLVFVRIHPFFDGNGRLARLLANLPVLAAGLPPILISASQRAQYINILWRYQWAVGQLTEGKPLLPDHRTLLEFRRFLRSEWQTSIDLVTEAKATQAKRKRN